jgi:hypothetical protein
MSNEIEYSRRENGLTVRFLAQCLVNDLVFPDQAGVKVLLSMARVGCRDGTRRCLPFDLKGRFEYQFLFHPRQDSIKTHGNAYLHINFPQLDYIVRARIVQSWR